MKKNLPIATSVLVVLLLGPNLMAKPDTAVSNPSGMLTDNHRTVRAAWGTSITTREQLANITNDLVQALSVDGANGIPRWESYVLGLDPTDPKAQLRLTATSKDAATVTITGLIDTTKFPEIENVAVTFRLAEQNSDKWTDVDGCTGSDVPSFTRPLEGVADKVLRIFADIEVR